MFQPLESTCLIPGEKAEAEGPAILRLTVFLDNLLRFFISLCCFESIQGACFLSRTVEDLLPYPKTGPTVPDWGST